MMLETTTTAFLPSALPSALPSEKTLLAQTETDTLIVDQPAPPEGAKALTKQTKKPSLVTIIETVQRLKSAFRPPTPEEREIIQSWSGWGAYAPAFEPDPKEGWETVGPQIRMLLGDDGHKAASAATPTSFFTSPYISTGIWRIAESLGFQGGTVLEPGCGTGQILSHAPTHLALTVTGIEREPFSASVAQLLHPEANIINAPLQKLALPEGGFDLVVGNVPFADVPIYDRTLPFKEKLSLHNYFIYRSLQATRPGGFVILVTTRYTMDATHTWMREEMAKLGLLLGAIRLPSYGHKWAKTAVVTDILVLQRRYPGMTWSGQDWMAPATLVVNACEIPTNTYFVSHPEQILGTPMLARGMYRENEPVVKAPDDLEGAFSAAIDRIKEETIRQKSTYVPRIDPSHIDGHLVALREDGLREGCFYLLPQDGQDGLVEIVNGQPKSVRKSVAELTSLVQLREAALALMEAERDFSKPDEALKPLRLELNRRYDLYVKHYGPVRRSTLIKRIDKETGEESISRRLPTAMYAFKHDEHYPLILGLEVYDDATQQARKAKIFFERVNQPATYKDTAESPEEAIALSLDRYGRLNFSFIAQATGRAEQDIAAYLGDLAYEDPEEGHWEITPLYLSGNVRHKLNIARRAMESEPAKWQRNVLALEKVQPEPLAPEDIKVLLGAPWIPVEYIVQFCVELVGMRPAIKRDTVSGSWDVVAPVGVRFSPEATSTWGTGRASAFKLVEHLLNHKTTVIEDTDHDGKTHVNQEETMLAQQKKREIQARFGAWIWEENERTKTLVNRYNELYNGVVPTRYDGSHLSFPGMDPFWAEHLYSWQRDFIARMITSRSALCAFPVGAGKTKIQVAGAMTLLRMGLATKVAIVVPNHLIEQITSEAKQLYPAANILMISRDDLAREKRRLFMARIAIGDHDLVVMTHSAFEAIGVHAQTKQAYIEEKLQEYQQVLYSLNEHSTDKSDKRRIKQIEKQMQRLEEKLQEQLDVPHDAGLTFEQLGISYIVVDEFHFYKNLGLPTNQEKLTVTPSQRAQDMLMKMSWLEKRNGTRPFAATFTATPISNSMVEALVMLWYLDRGLLEKYEIFGVDDFSSLYIESEEKIEITPNGAGFRMYERPSKFVNLPEFMHLFKSITDIRSPEILADKRPDLLEHTVSVEPTPQVIDFVNELVIRSEKLKNGNPMAMPNGKLDNMLWVTGDGRKAALWLGLHGIEEAYPAKLDAIAIETAKVYHRWQENAAYLPGTHKSLQILFCDQGTPSKEKGDQVYGELKKLLTEKGIPAQGIRFIHEAETDAAKAVLFEQCRSGEVAVLIGSTGKLGTGTNIQTRCAAIHHCDAPWRPDEVEQRTGRGQRPGNLYPVVEVFYYVQKRTFDAYSWQILSNKAKFFNQIRSTSTIGREMDYSDDSSLTYGQVKAAATGDVLLLEHANVTLSADAFSRLHASFKRARDRDRQEASQLRDQAQRLETSLKRHQQIAQDAITYTQETPFMTPDRLLLTKKEAQRDFIAQRIIEVVKGGLASKKLGYWRGIPMFIRGNALTIGGQYSLVVGDLYTGVDLDFHAQWLEEDNHWRFAWKFEQYFQGLEGSLEEQSEHIRTLLKRAQEFETQSQKPFPQQAEWQAAMKRRQELDHYIDCAAKATTEESLQELARMRQHLLETAPKDLTERPQPKNTAKFVLPPRNPNGPAPQGETNPADETTTRIAVSETSPVREQTIEEVVKEIQQSIIGSKATVAFGDVETLKRRKDKKGTKKKKGEKVSPTQGGTETYGDLWTFAEAEAGAEATTNQPPVSAKDEAQSSQLSLW